MSRWRGWLGGALLAALAGCLPVKEHPPGQELAIHLARSEPAPTLQQMQDPDGRSWWVEQPARLCCKDFRSAELMIDESGAAVVVIRLSDEAGARLATLTRENIGQVMAVLANGKLLVAATLTSEISDGQMVLGGFDSISDAQRLIGR